MKNRRNVMLFLKGLLWLFVPVSSFYITELAFNESWMEILLRYIGCNCLIYLICALVLFLISGSMRWAFLLEIALSFLYGTASHYVLEFKSVPLRPGELLGAQTGLAVAVNYEFTLSSGILKAALLLVITGVLIWLLTRKRPRPKGKIALRLLKRLIGAGAGVFLFYAAFLLVNFTEGLNLSIYEWNPDETYFQAGSALCFLIDSWNMKVEKPDGYSTQTAEGILEDYQESAAENNGGEVTPDIIVVMNESFADLSAVGEFESEDYLSNWNSVSDYLMKGWAYSSVYGGGTCNSEFEFLTGSTMAFFKTNLYPYMIYRFDEVSTMTKVFQNLGYETIALHPSIATDWNRRSVYEQMGFDSFIYEENGFQDATCWGHWIDDASVYSEVISQLESTEEPAFIFSVTIQNHGSYNTKNIDDAQLVSVEEAYQGYDDVIGYLSDIKESDRAFGELIDYFRNSDDPVILCFFGDHQPSLSEEFLSAISAGQEDSSYQDRYKVPYMLWSNYLEADSVDLDLSFSYLGAWLLRYANASTPYAEYLLDLEETIQAVNSNGYMENDTWISLAEPDDALKNYEIEQYYHLFDH